MASEIQLSSVYFKESDAINITIFKHDGGVQEVITSGLLELRQGDHIIKTIEFTGTPNLLEILHPQSLTNLSVKAIVDTLIEETPVTTQEQVDQSEASFSTPETAVTIEPPEPEDVSVVESEETPFILIIDFTATAPVTVGTSFLEYAGGDRILFNDSNELTLQELNSIPNNTPNFVEDGASQLLPITANESPLDVDLSNYGANVYANEDDLSPVAPTYHIKGLGGSSSVNGDMHVVFNEPLAVTGDVTFQSLFSLGKIDTTFIPTFSVTATIMSGVTAVDTITNTYNTADFLNSTGMIFASVSGTGDLTISVDVDNILPGDLVDMFFTLPQVVSLSFPSSSISGTTRVKDVYSIDTTLDFEGSDVELDIEAGSNEDCYLFDMDNIHGRYESGDLIFNINGTEVSGTTLLVDAKTITFSFNVEDSTMGILVNDVPLVDNVEAFSITAVEKCFIACDKNGDSQLNGEIKSFKILKG